jgi:cysteinyl-tRNA synthetase
MSFYISFLNNSECHHDNYAEWVRIWIHTGHLHIAGRKMSKSLKNFISIKDYFAQASEISNAVEDDFRIFCLQHKYSALLTYAPERIHEASAFRKKLESFFVLMETIRLRSSDQNDKEDDQKKEKKKEEEEELWKYYNQKSTRESIELMNYFNEIQFSIQTALANDFDTPTALEALSSLLGKSNEYCRLLFASVSSSSSSSPRQPIEPLLSIYDYLSKLGSSSFGLRFCDRKTAIHTNSSTESSSSTATTSSTANTTESAIITKSTETAINLTLKARSKMKTQLITRLKEIQKELKSSSSSLERKELLSNEMKMLKQLLESNDTVRNEMKSHLNITIMDLANGETTWSK